MIANVQHWTELIAKRLSGNIREDEARMLDAWVARDPEHKEYYDHLTYIWSVTGFNQTDHFLPEADWDYLEKRLQNPGGKIHIPHLSLPKVQMPRIFIRTVAAAAVVLFGVLSVILLFNNQREATLILADAGNLPAHEIALPDGSKVILRKGSTLRYFQKFVEREVTLSGEAFFDITHDEAHPFTVVGGNGIVRVLGTKFNLKAVSTSAVELFVEEGRVAFAPAARKFDAKIFSAGQAGSLAPTADADVERAAAPGPNVTSWISGKLVFDHATLDHVLSDISRHFSVPMQVSDSSLFVCELKADFENATLENVLETLRFSLNLQIDKSGESYIVSGEPCATGFEN
ncbi:MAG TPA: FecR domain-containing protein [Saprospiraceae bacterium]|nr:FecR domain-containing protein [Saprospiraceae bacterium]